MNEDSYSKKNEEIECVLYKNCRKNYKPHTHASHLSIGCIQKGKVCIIIDGVRKIYEQGEKFLIQPNVLHEIKTIDNNSYSMMVLCIKINPSEQIKSDRLKKLQKSILGNPENIYLIEEMSKDSEISPYHLIRKFKKAFGLTPHQFQIQCKVRKAQKLLEKEKSIAEVTYDAGFCDQSHLDRCFRKIVGLTPLQYQNSLLTESWEEFCK